MGSQIEPDRASIWSWEMQTSEEVLAMVVTQNAPGREN